MSINNHQNLLNHLDKLDLIYKEVNNFIREKECKNYDFDSTNSMVLHKIFYQCIREDRLELLEPYLHLIKKQ